MIQTKMTTFYPVLMIEDVKEREKTKNDQEEITNMFTKMRIEKSISDSKEKRNDLVAKLRNLSMS